MSGLRRTVVLTVVGIAAPVASGGTTPEIDATFDHQQYGPGYPGQYDVWYGSGFANINGTTDIQSPTGYSGEVGPNGSPSYTYYDPPIYRYSDLRTGVALSGPWTVKVQMNGQTSVYDMDVPLPALQPANLGGTAISVSGNIVGSIPRFTWSAFPMDNGALGVISDDGTIQKWMSIDGSTSSLSLMSPLPAGRYSLEMLSSQGGAVQPTLTLISGPEIGPFNIKFQTMFDSFNYFTVMVPEPSTAWLLPATLMQMAIGARAIRRRSVYPDC